MKRFVLWQEPASCLPLAHHKAFAKVDFGEFQYYDAYETEHKAYELGFVLLHKDAAQLMFQVIPEG